MSRLTILKIVGWSAWAGFLAEFASVMLVQL